MIHRELEDRLRRMGLNACYRGYAILIHGALLIRKDPDYLTMPSKLLYPKLGAMFSLTTSGVDQAIRTAIRVCLRTNAPEVERVCGVAVPTVQQFLSGLSGCPIRTE